MKKTSNHPKGSPVGPQSDEIDWEMRPGGMLVQMRDDADAGTGGAGAGAASSRGPMIKIKVSHGPAHYELSVPAHSTFGIIFFLFCSLSLPFHSLSESNLGPC